MSKENKPTEEQVKQANAAFKQGFATAAMVAGKSEEETKALYKRATELDKKHTEKCASVAKVILDDKKSS